MIKMLLSSSLVVGMLCAPALADPQPAQPPHPSGSPLEISATVTTAGKTRTYAIKTIVGTCSSIEAKESGRIEDTVEDELDMCTFDGTTIQVELNWRTRDRMREWHHKSSVLVKRGSSFSVDTAGAKLAVALK